MKSKYCDIIVQDFGIQKCYTGLHERFALNLPLASPRPEALPWPSQQSQMLGWAPEGREISSEDSSWLDRLHAMIH